MQKIINPRTKKPIDLHVGDLVEFVTKEDQEGITELSVKESDEKKGLLEKVVKAGNISMIPPSMVVVEIVLENSSKENLYDEQTGKQTGAKIKANCVWFSIEKGEFFDRWFSIGVLRKVNPSEYSNPQQKIKGEIDEIVALKTYLLAHKSESHIFNGTWFDDNDKAKEWTLKQTFDLRSYLPPKMVVIEVIQKLPDKKPLFHKSTGVRTRELGTEFVKCMWFNAARGKFSEHVFSVECLIPGNQLPGQQEMIKKLITA